MHCMKYLMGLLVCSLLLSSSTLLSLTWSTPQNLSAVGQSASQVQVGIDNAGNAVANWQRFNGTHAVLQGSTYSSSTGIWTPTTDISNVPGFDVVSSDLAVDPSGNAVVIWYYSDGTNYHIEGATLAFGSST